MQTIHVSGLKRDPTAALVRSQDDLMVVMNRDQPEALLVSMASTGALELAGARAALATALFRDGHLSPARSARVAQMPVSGFMAHLSRLGIPTIQMSAAEVERDFETLDHWLA